MMKIKNIMTIQIKKTIGQSINENHSVHANDIVSIWLYVYNIYYFLSFCYLVQETPF